MPNEKPKSNTDRLLVQHGETLQYLLDKTHNLSMMLNGVKTQIKALTPNFTRPDSFMTQKQQINERFVQMESRQFALAIICTILGLLLALDMLVRLGFFS